MPLITPKVSRLPTGYPSFLPSDLPTYMGGNGEPQPPPISCAYPLDDDGTLATAFGYAYAGPAVGADSQSMDFTSAGAGVALLMPAGLFSTARFSRPASGFAVVEAAITPTTTVPNSGMSLMITNAGGTMINAFTFVGSPGDVQAILIDSDGAVSFKLNGAEYTTNSWSNGSGQKTVGESDMVSFYLWANASAGAQVAQITLRTDAADITGSYGAGGADPCGNSL